MLISRRVRTGLFVLGASSVAVAGCSSSGSPTPPASSSELSSSAASLPTSFDELEALIVTRVPKGFVQEPDAVGDTGPSDLAKAIRDDHGAPHARRELERNHFVRGYQRLWARGSTAQLIVFIYQFRTRAGASKYRSYGAHEVRRSATAATRLRDKHTFHVPGLPKRATSALAGRLHGRTVAAIDTSVGPFVLEIIGNGTVAAAAVVRHAVALARAQFNRLRAAIH